MTREQSERGTQLDANVSQDAGRELETILASITSILIQVEVDLTIRRWNPAAERALGRSAEQVVGAPLNDCGVRWREEDLRRLIADMALGVSPPGFELGFRDDAGEQRCLGVTLSSIETESGEERGVLLLARDITETLRKEEVQRRLITAVEQVEDTIVITDLDGTILYVNPAFERTTGYTREEALGAAPVVLKSGKHNAAFYANMWNTLNRGEVWSGHFTNKKKDGTLYEEDATISPVRNDAGEVTNYVAVKKDVTERLALEIQLRSCQKLESIGQLAAGIAHEINTPTQFISDNNRFLRDAFGKLDPLLKLCAELSASGGEAQNPADALKKIAAAADMASIAFVSEEIPDAIEESLSGLARVTEIVSAMKSFSHPGTSGKQPVDLNQVIATTVTLSTNEWKYVSTIETDFDSELPPVSCLPGEIGQVVLNMIVNAAHAIADVVDEATGDLGRITIGTQRAGEQVEIRISDTGCGMPEEVKSRIFDPFYTTKEVGRGTGQGLAISRSVVVDKHAGSIAVESEPGKGTTFIVRIPLDDAKTEAPEAANVA